MLKPKDFITYVSSRFIDYCKPDTLSTQVAELKDETLYKMALSDYFEKASKYFGKTAEREFEIIKLRSGWEGKPMTLEEIGNKLCRSRERIRQIESKAWRRIGRKPRVIYEYIRNNIKGKIENDIFQGKYGPEIKFIYDELRMLKEKTHYLESGLKEVKEVLAEKDLRLKPEEILSMPIDNLELSVRAYNCLRSIGIETIGGLVQRTGKELFRIKNMGRKSMNEIKNILAELGLSLKRGY